MDILMWSMFILIAVSVLYIVIDNLKFFLNQLLNKKSDT